MIGASLTQAAALEQRGALEAAAQAATAARAMAAAERCAAVAAVCDELRQAEALQGRDAANGAAVHQHG